MVGATSLRAISTALNEPASIARAALVLDFYH
jgi:hypothetical protein